ncbi:DUF11 domain-containing protein [Trujillonella endophytica]|uniref:DUF11 domain-containing protein n=1 Tax=Trujillonella endophytica TaxID=673521 RepID=A0A1H8VBF0_9ACTN|nr:DUF11 domain-containing protein [Trujillella endophytica]SEP12725.1 hypothetical protein SAMN05660991_03417 [Trujillella endophytica]
MHTRSATTRRWASLLVLTVTAALTVAGLGPAPAAAAGEASITVSDVTVVEGDSGEQEVPVTVAGTCPVAEGCVVTLTGVPQTATDGNNGWVPDVDYVVELLSQSGTTVGPGAFTLPLSLYVIGDERPEADETITLVASLLNLLPGPFGWTEFATAASSTGTIVNDDGPRAPATATIEAVSGGGQAITSNAAFPQPLVVRVTDAAGLPLAGVPVLFNVTSGPAYWISITLPQRSAVAVTGADGTATAPELAAGYVREAGVLSAPVTVTAMAEVAAAAATFTATVANVNLYAAAGDGQTAVVGSSFTHPLAVSVSSGQGYRFPGVEVEFAVTSGSASFGGGTPGTTVTVVSGTDGVATAPPLVAGATPGPVTVRASAVGSLQTVDFTATVEAAPVPDPVADIRTTISVPTTAAPGTPVTVRLTVTNDGPIAATALGAAIRLPGGVFPLHLGGGLPLQGGYVLFGRPSLAPNQSVTFTVAVRVNPGTRGTLAFSGGATSWFVPDPDLTDNNASASVTVSAPR